MTVAKTRKGFELFKVRTKLYWSFKYRLLTSEQRVGPDFIVIGGQKCGTTSLHRYIKEHPNIIPPYKKDSSFFDANFFRGFKWYHAYFPKEKQMDAYQAQSGERYITGEVTTSYIHHPATPQRIHEAYPKTKFIALLREPVQRAYSHYQHMVRTGREELSFKEAIAREDERLANAEERVLAGNDEALKAFRNYSYKSRGRYAEQLERWLEFFPREQFLIFKSEELFQDPERVTRQVYEFLDIPYFQLAQYKNVNPGGYPSAEAETLDLLKEYFRPHNERLAELLGDDFGWE